MRLAFLFWLTAAGAAFALEAPPSDLEDAVQDSQGIIWAYSRSGPGSIYRFDGSQWTSWTPQFDTNQSPAAMMVVKTTDGAVDCIWWLENHRFGVTRHRGGDSSLVGTCSAGFLDSGLKATTLADSQNRLWITGPFEEIYRADVNGGVKLIYKIGPEETSPPDDNPAQGGINEIKMVEDGRGRFWAWSTHTASDEANLRGVLLFTGDKAELRNPFPKLKAPTILTIARADDRHMWITVAGDGLYKIDIDSFELKRQPDPVPKALCCVHEIYSNGGDTYAVEDTPGAFTTTLWRLRGGQWSRIIFCLDSEFNWFAPRRWLPINEGLLVQSFGSGPWFIPTEGPPAQFSWRSGFFFKDFHSFCRFADGTFFGLSRDNPIFHSALSFPPHDVETPRLVSLNTDQGWSLDAAGHAWTLFKNPLPSLSLWEGGKWVPHAIPADPGKTTVQSEPRSVWGDQEGRLWVYREPRNGPVSLFNTGSGQWQTFANIRAAYFALRNDPPRFLVDNDQNFGPQYSADHQRIAYRYWVSDLYYYDGFSWHDFNVPQITGIKNDNSAMGPPWFDHEGRLCVNIQNRNSWRRDKRGKWSHVEFQSRFPYDVWSEGNSAPSLGPPEGCVTNHPDSIVVDNLGVTWLTWRGELYKCIPGLCVKILGTDEISPFRIGLGVVQVFVDPMGNTLFMTGAATDRAFLLKPKTPPPHTTLTIEPAGADAVVARMDAHGAAVIEFRWQLDDEAWKMSQADSIILDHLPNGSHLLKVTAIDDQLNMDGAPVTARFETKIDPNQQMALLIAQLADADYSKRELAVDALARQPAAALPALRKARETATDDQRWWIDAAIQECERRAAPSSKP